MTTIFQFFNKFLIKSWPFQGFFQGLGRGFRLSTLGRGILVLVLVLGLAFGHGSDAWAARSGGRVGGGSFRMPSRTYSAPSRTYSAPNSGYSGGYGGYGGGFGFNPFFFLPFPLFGLGGGGGLLGLLVMLAVASFLVRTVRQVLGGGAEGGSLPGSSNPVNPKVAVAKIQVGLTAQARSLQTDLTRLALTAKTDTSAGLSQLLQESTLALLRHPEFWTYGSAQQQSVRLLEAETAFNRLTLEERMKFSGESLSNVQGQVQRKDSGAATPENLLEDPGQYIIVTLVVGTSAKLNFPSIQGSEELQTVLKQVGEIGPDQLLALEILWTPQVPGEVLTTEELLAHYPQLQMM